MNRWNQKQVAIALAPSSTDFLIPYAIDAIRNWPGFKVRHDETIDAWWNRVPMHLGLSIAVIEKAMVVLRDDPAMARRKLEIEGILREATDTMRFGPG
jgi:hypothetical protein